MKKYLQYWEPWQAIKKFRPLQHFSKSSSYFLPVKSWCCSASAAAVVCLREEEIYRVFREIEENFIHYADLQAAYSDHYIHT